MGENRCTVRLASLKSSLIVVLALVVGVGALMHLKPVEKPHRAPDSVSGMVFRVVDGDSLYIGSHSPQIRLWGVDAPERSEQGFAEATKALSELVQGQHLRCTKIDQDRYSRTVARCFLSDGREINRVMIENGTAREYLKFSDGFYSR